MLLIQNKILGMIADGEPLEQTARQICVNLEETLPGVASSILTVDRAGLMHPLAGPSLPASYSAAIEGLMIGPEVGSCGTAAYRREPVVIDDIVHDPRFARFIHLLDGLDLQACWSFPVIDATGRVMAVLAVYAPQARGPSQEERELALACVDLCGTALRRQERIIDRERRATIDALTGLPNRLAFNAALANIACDEPGSWALFVLDLDNLKVVNDTFGHLAGDDLIRAAAAACRRPWRPTSPSGWGRRICRHHPVRQLSGRSRRHGAEHLPPARFARHLPRPFVGAAGHHRRGGAQPCAGQRHRGE